MGCTHRCFETDVIEKRNESGIINLFEIYLPIVDEAILIDNSNGTSKLIARQNKKTTFAVFDEMRYNQISNYCEHRKKSVLIEKLMA